jgi:uncharacterized protein (DUF488 family)
VDRVGGQHDEAVPLYTVGYGGATYRTIADRLLERGVDFLVDVRSKPYARYAAEFSREPLQNLLASDGIRYVFMGWELGGRPDDPTVYDDEGHVVYERVAATDAFRSGLDRLLAAVSQGHVLCLLCSEKDPAACHRAKLVGESLSRRGVDVRHIDGSGRDIGHETVMLDVSGRQLTLLADDPLRSRAAYR